MVPIPPPKVLDGADVVVVTERTWIHPLHAVGEFIVGNEAVPAPAGVGDDRVGGGQRRKEE